MTDTDAHLTLIATHEYTVSFEYPQKNKLYIEVAYQSHN